MLQLVPDIEADIAGPEFPPDDKGRKPQKAAVASLWMALGAA